MRSRLVLYSISVICFAVTARAQEVSGPAAVSPTGSFAGRVLGGDVLRTTTPPAERETEPDALPPLVASAERGAFDRLNAERAVKGLPELQWSVRIAALARQHSQNMAKGKFFSHQDADGLLVDERAARMGLTDWTAIGENIAFVQGFKEPVELAVGTWMKSPSHRNNVLAPRWTESAIGVAISEDGTYYFTQVFMARKQ